MKFDRSLMLQVVLIFSFYVALGGHRNWLPFFLFGTDVDFRFLVGLPLAVAIILGWRFKPWRKVPGVYWFFLAVCLLMASRIFVEGPLKSAAVDFLFLGAIAVVGWLVGWLLQSSPTVSVYAWLVLALPLIVNFFGGFFVRPPEEGYFLGLANNSMFFGRHMGMLLIILFLLGILWKSSVSTALSFAVLATVVMSNSRSVLAGLFVSLFFAFLSSPVLRGQREKYGTHIISAVLIIFSVGALNSQQLHLVSPPWESSGRFKTLPLYLEGLNSFPLVFFGLASDVIEVRPGIFASPDNFVLSLMMFGGLALVSSYGLLVLFALRHHVVNQQTAAGTVFMCLAVFWTITSWFSGAVVYNSLSIFFIGLATGIGTQTKSLPKFRRKSGMR